MDTPAIHASNLFSREFRTGREDEQFKVERADDMQRILYELSYAEEARAIIAHLNAKDHSRAIAEVPECFIGQQALYEEYFQRRLLGGGVGGRASAGRRESWSYVSTPRDDDDDDSEAGNRRRVSSILCIYDMFVCL